MAGIGLSGVRVLIVDDQIESGERWASLFSDTSATACIVPDLEQLGTQALVFLPHACVVDLAVLKVTGWDAVRALREESWAHGVVFIAVTSWPDKSRHSAHHSQFDYYIRPNESQEAIRIVRHHQDQSSTSGG